MVAVLFRCRHRGVVNPDKAASACAECGETRIARTLRAPAPRITGHGAGPHVQGSPLEPKAVSLASVPLRLKPRKEDA